jgi:WD repeat-containing protein 92
MLPILHNFQPWGNNLIQVYALEGQNMKLVTEMEKKSAFKCGTFGTSTGSDRKFSTGSFDGHLQIWDMEKPVDPVFSVQAHASIVNAVDGCGGMAKGYGAPEIATCGRDGCVRLWDPRQENAPVAAFQPTNKENVRYLSSYRPAYDLEGTDAVDLVGSSGRCQRQKNFP